MIPIEIDGSYLEGGGQIIRCAVGLSAVTGVPCRIINIRKGRKKPGLMAQHLSGVIAVSKLCSAKTSGLEKGSLFLEFHPGELKAKDLTIEIGTAGSIGLVLQSLMIPASTFTKKVTFTISGGTHVEWAPSIDYFNEIFCFFLGEMGIEAGAKIERHGFYPAGGGKARVTVKASGLQPISLEDRGEISRITAVSVASRDLAKAKVAERQVEGAEKVFSLADKKIIYADTISTGTALLLKAYYAGGTLGTGVLGKRGFPAEEVGKKGALLLKEQIESGATLDEWMADQILPFAALANGKSRFTVSRITEHVMTEIYVLQKFLPAKIKVEGEIGQRGRCEIEGCGITNSVFNLKKRGEGAENAIKL